VVLYDGQAQQITLPASDLESLQPLRTSLMPDGQLASLTPQQAADLIAYLVNCTSESPARQK
jgi:hypothetical protein